MAALAFSPFFRVYAPEMGEPTHLILKIETTKPIELGEFVATFLGLGSQYERHYDAENPDDHGNARFYVKEVRAGSIIAELIPYFPAAGPLLGGALAGVKHANDLAKFVENFGGRLRTYFVRGGREAGISKAELGDYLKTVQAVASDPSASLSLAVYEDKERRVAFSFNTSEAREAEHNILEHRTEMEKTSDADHQRVLMTFTRTNVTHAKAGKRSGELVQIEAVHHRALPIVYASNLAEERIRHEVADADDNVYKKAFDVDVNVELRGGKAVAYRLVAVHDVIDLPEPE